jgi:membrane protease YdiL (CAAX protease family)
MVSRRTIAVFLSTLVVAAWAVQVLGLSINNWKVSNEILGYLIGTMFLPTAWTLVFILFNRRAARVIRWKPGRISGLLAAPLIPAAIAFAALTVVLYFNWGTSGYFDFSAGGASVIRGPWVLGSGDQAWSMFILNMVATAVFFGVVNSITAVGEEFCWRGFLQPHMVREFGLAKGLIILGVVWGIWHLPVNLAGYNNPEYPILGALVLFPASLVAHSFILAALTIWSRSFWPAVFFHGSVNGIYGGVTSKIDLAPGISRIAIDLTIIGVEVGLAVLAWTLLVLFYNQAGERTRRPIS